MSKQEPLRGVHQGILERHYPASIDRVLSACQKAIKQDDEYAVISGKVVKVTGHTLTTFLKKGCTCVNCGIQGEYFAIERHPKAYGKSSRWTLNLYAVNAQNEEVLMTRDHILPRSLGGRNCIENHNPMCTICNLNKGNRIERESREWKQVVQVQS